MRRRPPRNNSVIPSGGGLFACEQSLGVEGPAFLSAPLRSHLSRAPERIDSEANNRSFDYVNALASEFVHSAQDDNGNVRAGLRILSARAILFETEVSQDDAGDAGNLSRSRKARPPHSLARYNTLP